MQYAVSIIIIASQDSKTTTLNYDWLCFKNCLLNQFTSYVIVRLMRSNPIKKITHKHTKPKQCYKKKKKKKSIYTHTYALDAVVQRTWDTITFLSSLVRIEQSPGV